MSTTGGYVPEPTPMPRTWLWIDRHVHKNGGTTVRKIMQKLRGLNVSTYYGWTGAKGLEVLLRRNVTPAWPSGTTCEVHEGVGDFMGRHMQRIDATLRPRVERLVLTTRVREPTAFYVSAWLWCGEPRYWRFANRTFDWWAPRNLQANLLLRGDFRGWMDGTKRSSTYDAFDARAYATLLDRLRRFDLVWPLEAQEAGLRALGRLLGWPAHVATRVAAVRPVAPKLGTMSGAPRDHPDAERRLCNGSCDALVAQRAPWDRQLYAWASERWHAATGDT